MLSEEPLLCLEQWLLQYGVDPIDERCHLIKVKTTHKRKTQMFKERYTEAAKEWDRRSAEKPGQW